MSLGTVVYVFLCGQWSVSLGTVVCVFVDSGLCLSLGTVVCVFGDSGLCLWGQWSMSFFVDSGLCLWGQWSVSLGDSGLCLSLDRVGWRRTVVYVFGDSGPVSLGTVPSIQVCVFEDSGLSLWGQWSVSLGIASDWGRGWLDMAKVTRVSYFWVVH